MVQESEQRLLFASEVGIEGPGENRLRVKDEPDVGPHTTPALRAVIPAAAGGEFIEPYGRVEIALDHQRPEAGAHCVAGIETLRAVLTYSL